MADDKAQDKPAVPAASPHPKCGLVMPISAIGDCTASHWADVKAILTEAIAAAGFEANLVSFANESRIIQNTIVENLYQNEMVVVDVSWKNPNVMFELGLRLAFDRPTVVVKDIDTDYAFDTSPIVHLLYPRSLRYSQIVDFKKELATKVKATYEAAKDPTYKSFAKTFGITKVAMIETKEVSRNDFIIEQLKQIRSELQELRGHNRPKPRFTILDMLDKRHQKILFDVAATVVKGLVMDGECTPTKAFNLTDKQFLEECPAMSGLHDDTRRALVDAAVKCCLEDVYPGISQGLAVESLW